MALSTDCCDTELFMLSFIMLSVANNNAQFRCAEICITLIIGVSKTSSTHNAIIRVSLKVRIPP
jgi:hypothetical protein